MVVVGMMLVCRPLPSFAENNSFRRFASALPHGLERPPAHFLAWCLFPIPRLSLPFGITVHFAYGHAPPPLHSMTAPKIALKTVRLHPAHFFAPSPFLVLAPLLESATQCCGCSCDGRAFCRWTCMSPPPSKAFSVANTEAASEAVSLSIPPPESSAGELQAAGGGTLCLV
jgi:hypothetical protein